MNQGMAGDDLRPDLHAAAIDALAASPLPALLAEVETLRKAVLGTDPRALRRSVGWLGRRGASTRLRQASRRHELREQNNREGRSTPHRIPGAAEPYMAGRME